MNNTILDFLDVKEKAFHGEHGSVSFSVSRGEIVTIECDDKEGVHAILDMAEGLLIPSTGSVLFMGRSWKLMDDTDANKMRLMVGRILYGRAWISNLTIMENISLSLLFYDSMSLDMVTKTVAGALDRYNLSYAANKRPHEIGEMDRGVLQWIRAFSGTKKLVLLDCSKDFSLLLENRREMLAGILAQGLSEGMTVVAAFHDELSALFMNLEGRSVRRIICRMKTSDGSGEKLNG